MKTDIIHVNSQGTGIEQALAQVDAVAAYKRLPPKNTLTLRLLAEELMALLRSITGQPKSDFWMEDKDGVYELHLLTYTRMSMEKREQLLSTATSGKNSAAKGIMGRIRDFFDQDADEELVGFAPMMEEGLYASNSITMQNLEWSMTRYRESISTHLSDQAAQEAWDELEKSVVSHVADDVKVFIRGDQVELVLYKKL